MSETAAAETGGHPASGLLCGARAALGAAYLLAASIGPPGSRGTGQGSPARAVIRILGGRHLAQAVITWNRPGSTVLGLGAGADVAHAASMVLLGVCSRRWRRAALADALVAASLAAAGVAGARRLRVPGR